MGGEKCLQLGLVHVEGLLEVTAKGSDQDLVDIELHDEIGKPPALGALYAVLGTVALCEAFLHDAGGRDGGGELCLLGGEGGLDGRGGGGRGGEGEGFCPEDANSQETGAGGGLAVRVCRGRGGRAGRFICARREGGGGGLLRELPKTFEHGGCRTNSGPRGDDPDPDGVTARDSSPNADGITYVW